MWPDQPTKYSSVTLPAFDGSYTKVCGRALGYQYYSTLAFFGYHYSEQSTLDGCYVDGVLREAPVVMDQTDRGSIESWTTQ